MRLRLVTRITVVAVLTSVVLILGWAARSSGQTITACPPGQSEMGCATPKPLPGATFGLPSGEEFPDVSDNNGPVNWSAVRAWEISHHWTPAGIFKMGEFVTDPLAEANSSELHQLGMAAVGYWFVRPIAAGCSAEARQIINAARVYGVRVVANDTEVAGLSGYPACLASAERKAGLTPVDYTASGTWFDNDSPAAMKGIPLWNATYGPSPFLSGLWTTTLTAWQFTETGSVPGINGLSDLSVDRGLLRLVNPPPVDIGGPEHLERYDKTVRTFHEGSTTIRTSERAAVKAWGANSCVNPVRRVVCAWAYAHLTLLRNRLLGLHAAGAKWSSGSPTSIGVRNQQFIHRLTATKPIRSWAAGLGLLPPTAPPKHVSVAG